MRILCITLLKHIITEVFYFFNPTKWTFKILKSGGDNFFHIQPFSGPLSFTKKNG